MGKYEDLILDALTKDGKVIIAEAKKLLITTIDNIVEKIVKIIHSITVLEDENIMKDDIIKALEHFKEVIEKEAKDIKEEMEKMVKKYTPKILDQLEKAKVEVIQDLKSLAVDILKEIIKHISDSN